MNNYLISEEKEKRKQVIENFDKNYLLEAGAGAGKTTIIVQRVINHIRNSDIDPSNLVAITFTKPAATELAERIQKEALKSLKTEDNPKIKERLKDVDKIFTGTIHSFCDLILREMPFHANLSPGYEIVEDDKEFNENIWYNFLRDKEQDYKEIMETLYKSNINYMDLRENAMLALSNLDIKFTGYDAEDYTYVNPEKEFERIKEVYGDLEYTGVSRGKSIGKLLYPILDEKGNLEDYLRRLHNAFSKGKFDVEQLLSESHRKNEVISDEKRYKDLIKKLYNIYINISAVPYNACIDFINMAVDYKYENYKNKLTFNELLHRASTLVKTSKEAREHFNSKYKYFYLDESQDTDPMQIELIMHLVDKDSDYNGIKSWQDVEPIPGSLFIVGDPKQSIYRFRRADISIYNQLKELIGKNGEVVYLDINFRSSDKICHWVESTFKQNDGNDFCFPEESTEIQAGFKQILNEWDNSLEEEKENEDFHLQGVYKYDYGEDDEEYVADIISELIKSYTITEKVREGEEYHYRDRKVEPGDIMVLTKSNPETGLYLRALKNKGIPALLGGEKILGDTREVLNLFLLIDAIVDYRDNIKLVSALRNCFYLDLETIDLFMEKERGLSKFMFFPEAIEKIEHLSIRNAFTHMNKIMKSSKELSPLAFIERLVENRVGVYEVNKDYHPLDLRDADSSLRQAIEILKTKECYSIYRLREELKDLTFKKIEYELPLNREEASDALRIMNIHKAKGLEANIVILVDGAKERYVFPDSHYVKKNHKDENIGYIRFSGRLGVSGPNETENRIMEKQFKEAEQDRLIYVAATRAKTVLIVANATGDKSFLYPLSTNISKELNISKITKSEDSILELSKDKDEERNLTKELRIKGEIYPSSYISASPSGFKGNAFYEEEKESPSNKSPKVKSAKMVEMTGGVEFDFGPRGKFYGTIVHEALEYLIKATSNLKEINEAIISYSAKFAINEVIDNLEVNKTNIGLFYPGQNIKVEEIIELSIKEGREKATDVIKKRLYTHVRDVLINFTRNEDIKELFYNAGQVFVELPFTIGLDGKNEDVFEKILSLMKNDEAIKIKRHNKTILINGIIDLVVKSKDNIWTILDYKTDRPIRQKKDLPNYLRNTYGSQLEGYKMLFEEIVKDEGIKVDNLLLYSTYMDEVISIE